jgi:hypothetical protein
MKTKLAFVSSMVKENVEQEKQNDLTTWRVLL